VPQKLGQHFLTSSAILDRIASAVCPEPVPLVVEIGPGRGALTEKLLDRAERVVAIELDEALVEHLRAKFGGNSRLEIVGADVLSVDLAQWAGAPVAGNLPYYITSPIIAKVLRAGAPRSVFLIQKEVAQRLAAKPGSTDYGYLTVQTAMFANARILFDVKPGAFRPPPKVDSSVVLLERVVRDLGVADVDAFLRFIGQCFRQKRKTLRNNLGEVYGRDVVGAWPEASLRAEQITLGGFAEMFRRLV
jgi:16S rRNA (adenine1518-N6/adenine1519-N6)-dimethyltransferase